MKKPTLGIGAWRFGYRAEDHQDQGNPFAKDLIHIDNFVEGNVNYAIFRRRSGLGTTYYARATHAAVPNLIRAFPL